MPLRIVVRETADGVEIALHGWLSGPEVAEFEQTCPVDRPLRLDLRGLSGADGTGVLSLREKQVRGALLTGASPYIEVLLGTRGRADEEGDA